MAMTKIVEAKRVEALLRRHVADQRAKPAGDVGIAPAWVMPEQERTAEGRWQSAQRVVSAERIEGDGAPLVALADQGQLAPAVVDLGAASAGQLLLPGAGLPRGIDQRSEHSRSPLD